LQGRITNENGYGVSKAAVSSTDSKGETGTARTSSFGYYKFEDVGAGETYVFEVASKRYRFTPQVVSIYADLTDLNAVANS